jgi:phosphoribosylformylglycinamidine synthase subunit PurS
MGQSWCSDRLVLSTPPARNLSWADRPGFKAVKARVVVTLKDGILDPQGKAIEGALKTLGISGVDSVRQGKVFDIEVATSDRTAAEGLLRGACEKLLANQIVENFQLEIP